MLQVCLFSLPLIITILTFISDHKIIDMLPDWPPQVTFSCDNRDQTCTFQFWTAQVESFYCALDQCLHFLPNPAAIPMLAKKSSVAVFQATSSAEKMVVLMYCSESLFKLSSAVKVATANLRNQLWMIWLTKYLVIHISQLLVMVVNVCTTPRFLVMWCVIYFQ